MTAANIPVSAIENDISRHIDNISIDNTNIEIIMNEIKPFQSYVQYSLNDISDAPFTYPALW